MIQNEEEKSANDFCHQGTFAMKRSKSEVCGLRTFLVLGKTILRKAKMKGMKFIHLSMLGAGVCWQDTKLSLTSLEGKGQSSKLRGLEIGEKLEV